MRELGQAGRLGMAGIVDDQEAVGPELDDTVERAVFVQPLEAVSVRSG